MDVIVHGADSETYHGKPMTLQFFSADTDKESIVFVNEKTATKEFMRWCDSVPRKAVNVVYCHNLEFDLPEFLWSIKEQLIQPGGAFEFSIGDWAIRGVYGKPTFCNMLNQKQQRRIMVLDSFSWFASSLAKAAELFCPTLKKLKAPENLGSKLFKPSDAKFCEYAMRDAVIAYHIGKSVQALIREFDIRQPVSLADMAAKIFRHHFVRHTIVQPNRAIQLAALKSYHGGKNNVVRGMAPAWHRNVTSMDISSAYPYAMAQLPSMSYENLYHRVPKKSAARLRSVADLGVYCVSGTAAACDWPVIFQHGFDPIQGKFSNVWIQGHELNEALRSGEVKLTMSRGYYYDADKDKRPSPFAAYCNDFYRRKESEKNPVQRYMYKIILNACYGKFIQTRKQTEVLYTDINSGETEETHELIAGGMFHPFIASAITAQTRAYIHQLEHAHKALHTATDGIFTKEKKPKRVPLAPRKGMGMLTVEEQGDLVLLRNKCYIFYTRDGKTKSQYFKNKRIGKSAKHGFQGTIYDLEKLVAHNTRRYTAARPNRLRESLKRKLPVNEFVTRQYVLKVGKIKVL